MGVGSLSPFPRRAFSILNHYLKRAKHAGLGVLSAYLRMKLNPKAVTTELFTAHKKEATNALYDTTRNGKRGLYLKQTDRQRIAQDTIKAQKRRRKAAKGKMDKSDEWAQALL